MANQHVGVRTLARADAVQEIADVRERHIRIFSLDDQRLRSSGSRMEFVVPPIDQQTPLRPANLYAFSSDSWNQGRLKRRGQIGGIFQQNIDCIRRSAPV